MVRFTQFEDEKGTVSYGIAQEDGSLTYAEGCPFAGTLKDTGRKATVKRHLAPVTPPTVMCIGLNYRSHADELKLPYPTNPVVFLKPPTTVTGHMAEIAKPRLSEKMDYEVELAVIIGKACKDVPVEKAMDYVLGYTCANDVSTRDWQKMPHISGSQWTRSKVFDNFAPLGPVAVTKDDLPDPHKLQVCTYVNGEKMQDANTSDLIFRVDEIVSFLSIGCTLQPGTVILTGTPFGVAEGRTPPPFLKPGDKCIVEIEGIGRLENAIVADPSTTDCFFKAAKL